jgi:hypothetical protein
MDGYLQSQGLKASRCSPIGSIRAKHVDIDTVTLFGMLYDKPYNTGDPRSSEGRQAMRENTGLVLFALDGLRNTFDFAFYVTTDGVRELPLQNGQ